jgi:hypothetical protein
VATATAVTAGSGGVSGTPSGAITSRSQIVTAAVPAAQSVANVTRRNREPKPDYFGTCAQLGFNNPVCIDQAIAAIEHARKHDHRVRKQAVILPNNFRNLSVAEQTFVIINLERVDRGVRPLEGLVPRLNVLSRLGATLRLDPVITQLVGQLLGIGRWASIWASDLGPLASDYDWMYNDGYGPTGSINIACQTPTSPGCWGHRHNILNKFKGYRTVAAGAGTAKPAGASIGELNVGMRGGSPHYSYTWKQALAHGANGHKITAGS